MSSIDNFERTPKPSRKRLSYRLAIDYEQELEGFYRWLINKGKNPDEDEGYAEQEASNRINRIDQFFRVVWDEYGEAVGVDVSEEHAEYFIDQLKNDEFTSNRGEPYSEDSKRKFKNAVESYYRFLEKLERISGWESDASFESKNHSSPDIFTQDEIQRLKKVSIEYKSIPRYESVSPEERDRWKAYLAQHLGIPKAELTKENWMEHNRHWKIPSLMLVSLCAGLRPVEVKRAKVSWFCPDKGALHIPKEDSAKNDDEWEVALTRKATNYLSRWMEQRELMDKYNNSDKIWLNRSGNPYESHSLNRLLRNLCDSAEIDTERRKIVWYSVRHTVGTYVTEVGGLPQAKEQLRHKSFESTLRYVHPSVDVRQKTLERIGNHDGNSAAEIMQEVMKEERQNGY